MDSQRIRNRTIGGKDFADHHEVTDDVDVIAADFDLTPPLTTMIFTLTARTARGVEVSVMP
jgi:hypothetical protein